jgi:hypothetical protein
MSQSNQNGISICIKKHAFAMKMVIATCLITLLTGCLSESDTGGVFNRVKDPVGTVSGLVQDTNGNALEGAIVSVAGQTKKTDAQGRYTFNNFPVSNVEGNDNDNNTNELAPTINIYVAPPQDGDTVYLSATISVGPAQAEIDGSNVSDNGDVNDFRANGSGGNTIENGAVTFVDGFVIEAPVAQLPALDNTVTGFLVDNTTGLPIVGKLVYLNVNNPGTLGSNGLANHVTLQDVNIAANAVTSENGEFKIEKVPNDSALDLIVEGYTFEMVSANAGDPADITTRIEDNVYLGNVYMTSIVVGDDRPPVITDVNIHSTVDPNSLEGRNVARTIQITLSESIATTPTENSVFVNYVDAESDRTVYLELASAPEVNGANITINTVDDLIGVDLNTPLFISFSRSDFADAADNGLSVSQSNGNTCQDDNVGAFCEFLKPNNSAWLDMPIDTFALMAIAAEAGNPFIESIDGVTGGVTDPSVAATLVLRFNKPLQPIADELMNHAVFVMIGPDGAGDAGNQNLMDYNDISFSLDEAGLSLTIELVGDPLPQNADVSVDLLQTAFRDEDDQRLMLNAQDVTESGFADDLVNGAVRVDFTTINSRQALAVELAVLVEDDAENNPIPTHRALQSVSDDPFGQLNSAEAGQRLSDLKDVIGVMVGEAINVDMALLSFALVPNAVEYELTAVNSLGARKNIAGSATPSRGLSISSEEQRFVRFQADGTGQAPLILLSNVELGDTFSLAAIDGFGVRTLNGDSDTKTLFDNTPPATILQNSYSVGNSVVAQSNTVGAGGQLVQLAPVDQDFGVPFFDVSPGLLGVLDGGTNSMRVTDLTNNSAKADLLSDAEEDMVPTFYDEDAYDNWGATRTIGIAVSENVEFVTSPIRGLDTLINNVNADRWGIVNDVTTDDRGVLTSSDLVTVSTNIISLATNEHDSVVNFNGVIQDTATPPNKMEADNSSKLKFRDRIPPMVVKAEYQLEDNDSVSLLIEFNEAINPETFTNVTLGQFTNQRILDNGDVIPAGSEVLLPAFGDDGFSITTSNKAVTVSFNTITDGRPGAIWENEVAFFDLNTLQVEDQHGNSWNNYSNSTGNFSGSQGVPKLNPIPRFAVRWNKN